MKKILCLGAFFTTMGFGSEIEPQDKVQILSAMVKDSIRTCMEIYHRNDWLDVSNEAKHFWRWDDPSPILEQKIKRYSQDFYTFLLKVLKDKDAAIIVLNHYFNYQIDCLKFDYESNIETSHKFYFWAINSPQFYAIQAFSVVANSYGLKFGVDNKKIEVDAQPESEATAEVALVSLLPPAPPPLPKKTMTVPIIKVKGEVGETRGPTKMITLGTSALPDNVLKEIKKGAFSLKKTPERAPSAKKPEGDLESILRRHFEKIRPMLAGE